MGRIRQLSIMLVDNHQLMRHSMKVTLEHEEGFFVVAETDNYEEAVMIALEVCPDVLIMDISMPGRNAVKAIRQIFSNNSDVKVLGLSIYNDPALVMGMLNSGAQGFLLKSCTSCDLIDAVKTLVKGGVFLCHDVAGVVLESALNPSVPKKDEQFDILTTRDREVLGFIAEGKKSIGIAQELGISKRTVDIHRRNLMKKLNVNSVAELTKFAIRWEISSLY